MVSSFGNDGFGVEFDIDVRIRHVPPVEHIRVTFGSRIDCMEDSVLLILPRHVARIVADALGSFRFPEFFDDLPRRHLIFPEESVGFALCIFGIDNGFGRPCVEYRVPGIGPGLFAVADRVDSGGSLIQQLDEYGRPVRVGQGAGGEFAAFSEIIPDPAVLLELLVGGFDLIPPFIGRGHPVVDSGGEPAACKNCGVVEELRAAQPAFRTVVAVSRVDVFAHFAPDGQPVSVAPRLELVVTLDEFCAVHVQPPRMVFLFALSCERFPARMVFCRP